MIRYLAYITFTFLQFGCMNSAENQKHKEESVKRGEALFLSSGCTACHSLTGEVKYGPPLNTLFDSTLHVVRKGSDYYFEADRAYILRSMEKPDYEKLYRFKNRKMPVLNLKPEEMEDLAEYLMHINHR